MPNETLLYFVKERENIRIRKERGELPPYTADPILAQYRFTNVRRKHDRVSRWLQHNVLTPANLKRSGVNSFIQFAALCRLVNWPPSISDVLYAGLFPSRNISWEAVITILLDRAQRREKVWTGAYMIRAGRDWGRSKVDFVVRDVILGMDPHLSGIRKALKTRRRRIVCEAIEACPSFGTFYAGQVVDDLTWTPLLTHPLDNYTWAPQGPGSLRGFNRLMGLPERTRHNDEEWCAQLIEWRREIIDNLGLKYRTLTCMDCQNVLCEIFKFLKTKSGQGRPRAKYRPETAY